MYGKTHILEFCSTSLVEEIRKWVYDTYPEVTPLSYYFLSKPGVLWKLMKREHLKKKTRLFLPFLTIASGEEASMPEQKKSGAVRVFVSLKVSVNKSFQNIVTWGVKLQLHNVGFVCFSTESWISGVPPNNLQRTSSNNPFFWGAHHWIIL